MSTSKSHPQRHQEREIARAKRYAAQSGLLAIADMRKGLQSLANKRAKDAAHWAIKALDMQGGPQ
jgi:hypothetical protein